MHAPTISIAGIDVQVEGRGDRTIVMLHGWPDTLALWDDTVAALRKDNVCVRFTLPGFDLQQPHRATSLQDMSALLLRIVQATSPTTPVTLLMHDWGCVFGYEFAARYPERVAHIIAVDIGDHHSPALQSALTPQAKRQIFYYQIWLALAWKLGRLGAHRLANRMTRTMARWVGCRNAPPSMGWQMNYPYAMQWLGLAEGFGCAAPVAPHCPVLYLYGKRKRFMFHSPQWLERLQASPGSRAVAMRTGHWVMLDAPQAFLAEIRAWL